MSCGSEAQQDNSDSEPDLVKRVSQILTEKYVDSTIANEIADELLRNQQLGKYDGLELDRLINAINLDIHSIHNDRHIQLINIKNTKKLPWTRSFIKSVKILEGNIGYLKFSHFPNPNDEVFKAVASSFDLLAGCSGIILDLRDNRGGHPDVVSDILGYFTEGSVVYEQFHIPNENKTHKYATHKKVMGDKLINKPLSVLTNQKTASSAELLALAVQNLDIGKVYGQSTMGLVNLSEYYPVNDSIYLLASKGKQQNPFTEKGIEGVGVIPDVVISEDELLGEVQLNLIKDVHGETYRQWFKKNVKTHKLEVHTNVLDKYVGKYDDYLISKNANALYYHDPSGFKYKLQPLDSSTFRLVQNFDDRFRLIFEMEEHNVFLTKKYFDGTDVKMKRTDL